MTRLNALAARKYTDRDGNEKTSYTRIGVAWPFRDKEGYTVRLEAMPAPQDGEFVILLMPPKDNQERPQDNAYHGDDTAIPF